MSTYEADFKNFMLGNGGISPIIVSPATASNTQEVDSTPTHVIKRTEKKYWTLIKAFQGILEREWLNADDNLGVVVSSIFNLRQRIYWESKQIMEMKKQMSGTNSRSSIRQGNVYLRREDVEFALSYDLNRHEQMMSAARSLLSNLNQAQETLGRRLEEIILHDLYTRQDDIVVSSSLCTTVTQIEKLYHDLAAELYRKQELSSKVLESTTDQLFAVNDDYIENLSDERDSPRYVAQSSSRQWSRTAEESFVRETHLQAFLKTGVGFSE
mmetsp:Transcript_11678/g.17144  ORF Transcript_11678/g.17144 Transcript_11678/m.17144 type:complete len:269 (-) Transcript_11678:47-853(-)|eukprot:CAMPEP_0194213006 /NCGR_PEP_ID=MMETSP0156-20130528/13296_1 /TAXON_ID=33649 /ORGANISM="Thalassionema nitzschioides, Strain L26-B" /LENGTH=268 /DNA_ID=CAMNT_0038940947 /DNA_START=394 /DNA_END=1200 /DNA_ORIENTATION=+